MMDTDRENAETPPRRRPARCWRKTATLSVVFFITSVIVGGEAIVLRPGSAYSNKTGGPVTIIDEAKTRELADYKTNAILRGLALEQKELELAALRRILTNAIATNRYAHAMTRITNGILKENVDASRSAANTARAGGFGCLAFATGNAYVAADGKITWQEEAIVAGSALVVFLITKAVGK